MEEWVNKIHQGNTLDLLKQLPDECINMVMTSPPYWNLRDYGDDTVSIWDGDPNCDHNWEVDQVKNFSFCQNETAIKRPSMDKKSTGEVKTNMCTKCGAWKGQLGLEPTFDLFIKHLCDIFDEVKRVLRDDGTIWVNLGDTYGGSNQGYGQKPGQGSGLQNVCDGYFAASKQKPAMANILQKSLIMIPFRFAIEMVNRGWILRNTIIWHKRNCMPSSVKDRFTVDYEYLFFFSKKRKYYFETQYEPYQLHDVEAYKKQIYKGKAIKDYESAGVQNASDVKRRCIESMKDGKGRNKRTVWTINPKPFPQAHFAVFPEELCQTPIKAGCPEFICTKCGKPREQIINRINLSGTNPSKDYTAETGWIKHGTGSSTLHTDLNIIREVTGLTKCDCDAGFAPGIVLDIFNGSGTTCLVSKQLGRRYIGFDISEEYCKMARKRVASYVSINKWISKSAPKTKSTNNHIDWSM